MMKGQTNDVQAQQARSLDALAKRLLMSLKRNISRWYELHRQRRQLAVLSDGALKDLGLSRADIYQETGRHFWNDPMKR